MLLLDAVFRADRFCPPTKKNFARLCSADVSQLCCKMFAVDQTVKCTPTDRPIYEVGLRSLGFERGRDLGKCLNFMVAGTGDDDDEQTVVV